VNKEDEFEFKDDLYIKENDEICNFTPSNIINPTITLTKDA